MAISISYNPSIRAAIENFNWETNGTTWVFLPPFVHVIHILLIVLILTVYAIFMSFWILLFSINDNLNAIVKIQSKAPEGKKMASVKLPNYMTDYHFKE
ncbi:hypothetical protein OAL09_05260 [Verrucomicrobia bacterium]|nr:hypothetical protein [Verrucomicrobiota bacterium]